MRGLRSFARLAALLPALAAGCAPHPAADPSALELRRSALGCASAVTAVSLGASHSCALLADGTVECWGSNDYGQLGDGTTTSANVPQLVPGLSGVTAIGAGEYHTCAVVAGGEVRCWGVNDVGELGSGAATSSAPYGIAHPVTVSGLTGATAVVGGFQHSCALLGDGTVACWGGNGRGMLGDGTTSSSTVPVAVSGLANVTNISAGEFHTCAVLASGGVRCWGSNSQGWLGDGTTTDRHAPVAVSSVTGATQVTAGDFHTCALLSSGGVRCWGENDFGALGDGTTTSSSTRVTVSGLTTATAVSAGYAQTCALLSGGTVECWGENASGELGHGTVTRTSPPGITAPVSVLTLDDATAISVRGNHACALRASGDVSCWGNNQYGELGTDAIASSRAPFPVPGLSSVTDVSLSDLHSCVRLATGAVDCWGLNYYGGVGDGTTDHNFTPTLVTGLAPVVDVSASSFNTCAVTTSGTVRCWGDLSSELGTTSVSLSPVSVPGLTTATAVAGGTYHACALRSNHTVACWGLNRTGQLGDGSTTDRTGPVSVSGLSDATAIAVGTAHSCALRSGGTVACWGSNSVGQIGDGSTSDRQTPAAVSGLSGITAIAAGGASNCAIRSDGTVACWGYGTVDGSANTTPTSIAGLTGIVALAVGPEHACALHGDGTVDCWGQNEGLGALGNRTGVASATPVRVIGLSGASAIAVGGDLGKEVRSCAVLSSGQLECWGDVRLTTGDRPLSSTPVSVACAAAVTPAPDGGASGTEAGAPDAGADTDDGGGGDLVAAACLTGDQCYTAADFCDSIEQAAFCASDGTCPTPTTWPAGACTSVATGSVVVVDLLGGDDTLGGVTLTFQSTVATGGEVGVSGPGSVSSTCPLPGGFDVVKNASDAAGQLWDIDIPSSWTAPMPVKVCVHYDPSLLAPSFNQCNLKLFHGSDSTSCTPGGAGWTSINDGGVTAVCPSSGARCTPGGTPGAACTPNTICGIVTDHFSPFAVAAPMVGTAPFITVPGALTVEASGAAGAAVSFTATATDPQDGPITPTCVPASGSTFPFGTTSVTCTASDQGGLVATGSFNVTVRDTTGPVIGNVPGQIVAYATSAAGAKVTYPTPGAVDAVDGSLLVTCNPASGTTFPLGVTPVGCSASDSRGNTSTRTFTVSVQVQAAGGASFFLFPLRGDGSSIFRIGRPVPVRFRLTGASAGITDLVARLTVTKISNAIQGTTEDTSDEAEDDTDFLFKYRPLIRIYAYRWRTRDQTQGTYRLRADLGDGVVHETTVSLKAPR